MRAGISTFWSRLPKQQFTILINVWKLMATAMSTSCNCRGCLVLNSWCQFSIKHWKFSFPEVCSLLVTVYAHGDLTSLTEDTGKILKTKYSLVFLGCFKTLTGLTTLFPLPSYGKRNGVRISRDLEIHQPASDSYLFCAYCDYQTSQSNSFGSWFKCFLSKLSFEEGVTKATGIIDQSFSNLALHMRLTVWLRLTQLQNSVIGP